METKRFTQFGTFTVITLSLLLIFSVIMALTVGVKDNQAMIAFSIMAVIAATSLVFFYRLVIEIDGTYISFKLGIGFLSRKYRIDSLIHCRPVKNSIITGIGIRKIDNGWLYNVTGLKAVELTFKNTGKVIRIGTDKPDEIAQIITGLMNTTLNPDEEYASMKNQNVKSKNTIIFVAVVLTIIGLFTLYGYQPPKIDLQKNRFEISGQYGVAINYSDIAGIDTISQMPTIEMRTNGLAIGKVCKGYFRLSNVGSATLFVNFSVSPFVHLVLKNGQVIYFNLKDRQSTIETFEKIKAKTK